MPHLHRAEVDVRHLLAVLAMIDRHKRGGRRVTLGANKGYDVREFIVALRARGITPYVAIAAPPASAGSSRPQATGYNLVRLPKLLATG